MKKQIQEQVRDVMVVWELRGEYPTVPFSAGVDYQALIAGDTDPMFVTLPIGKAGVTSGNGRHYDEAFLQELERQTAESKPVGLFGHLKPEDRATSFPAEAVHWVGVQRVGELLWGKGYVPPGEARERIRRYKAAGKKIATSIDAFAKGVWDEGLKAYRMLADSMRLNQIDIAPADRAGIPDLAVVPFLTMEMDTVKEEITMADRFEIIREMKPEDAKLLPDAVREAVLSAVQPAPEVALITELRQALGVDEKANLFQLITELKQQQEQQRKTAVTGRIRELVEDKEKGIKVEALRGLVTELVTARNPGTAEEAEAAYTAVVGSESVKSALAAHVQSVMGPRQGTPLQPVNGQNKYFNIPQEAKEVAK